MPVVRNPQFNFKEGFCWSDINTHYLKCRIKPRSINDVKSMSLYGLSKLVPEYYIISIINSTFMSFYVDNFVNNTQTFQINDARQLPFIVPTNEELSSIKTIYDEAIEIKREQFKSKITDNEAEERLSKIQNKIDRIIEKLYQL